MHTHPHPHHPSPNNLPRPGANYNSPDRWRIYNSADKTVMPRVLFCNNDNDNELGDACKRDINVQFDKASTVPAKRALSPIREADIKLAAIVTLGERKEGWV